MTRRVLLQHHPAPTRAAPRHVLAAVMAVLGGANDAAWAAPATSATAPAATSTTTPAATPATAPRAGARHAAATTPHPNAAMPAPAHEHISVTQAHPHGHQPGGGLLREEKAPKSVSTIGTDFMDKQVPSATAFDMVAMLPGANVATSDPLGFSPQTNINVRGMGGDSIGYLLEGMPLNDIAYYNGYPGQFADTENYQTVSLAQGAADLDAPVLNAAGGLMEMTFRDPAERAGGYADVSYGSYNTNREFLRLETGTIGHTGIRGFVSYSHGYTDNWRGPGHDERQHIDFKFLRDWGDDNRVSLIGTWNTMVASYYPLVDKADWKQSGPFGAANNLARTFDPDDAAGGADYAPLYRQPERIFYVAAPSHFNLTHGLRLKMTPYAQWSYGNDPSGTTLADAGMYAEGQATPRGVPGVDDLVRANWTQNSYRAGVNATLDWHIANHDLVLGAWYDYSDDNEKQPFTAVSANGYAPDIWVDRISRTILTPDGRQLQAGGFHSIAQTNALYVGDRMTFLHKKLHLEVGFKDVMLDRHGSTTDAAWNQTNVGSNTSIPLPRMAISYQITPRHQVFFNTTTSFRTPDESALFTTYSPITGALDPNRVKNQYSVSEELGYRYSGTWLMGGVTLFNYDFTNREIQTTIDVNNATVASTLNGGGQTTRGVDVEIGTHPWHHWSPYLSGEYLHATIDDDISVNGDLLRTRGRTAVNSPTLQASAGISYDDGHFFGMADVKYVGHQYATFMNDERLSDHTTGNLAFGYRMDSHYFLSRPELRMNFINITNQHYLSGVAAPTFNARDTTGVHGTTIAGQTPTYYVGGGLAVLFTASTGF